MVFMVARASNMKKLLLIFVCSSALAQLPSVVPVDRVVVPKPAIMRASAMLTEPLTATPTSKAPVVAVPGIPIGQEGGTCTVAAARGFLQCNVPGPRYVISQAPRDWVNPVYLWATTHDGFADNDNDINGGTDSETVGKRLRQLGYTATNPFPLIWTGEILRYLQDVGPGVMGSRWYNSMDRPNPATGEVNVDPSSGIRGGHAYLCFKWRPAEKVRVRGKMVQLPERVYFQQSWLGFAPFDILPESPQIFWMSIQSFKRIVNAGLGCLWRAPKAKPKVRGNPTSCRHHSHQCDLVLAV